MSPSSPSLLSPECTGTCVTLWTGHVRYNSLALVGLGWFLDCPWRLFLNTSVDADAIGMWESQRDFQKVWEGWTSRLYGFPYSVISMACFGNERFDDRPSGIPTDATALHLSEQIERVKFRVISAERFKDCTYANDRDCYENAAQRIKAANK